MQDLQMIIIRKDWTRHLQGNIKGFDKKLMLFNFIQSTLFSTSLHTLFSWILKRNRSIVSTSQSFKGLEKQGNHPLQLTSPKHPPPVPLLKQLWQIDKGN